MAQQQQQQQQQQLPNLEIEKLQQALQYILLAPNEQTRKDANQFLLESERHPNFPVVMLQIFEQAQDDVTKQTAFIYVKNSIQRYWKQVPKKYQNTVQISTEAKNTIRLKFIEYIANNQSERFRQHLNKAICYIVQHDFPNHYKELYEYIVNTLQQIENQVMNGQLQILTENQTKNFVQSLKLVLRQQAAKRTTSTRQVFAEVVQSMMKSIVNIWEVVSNGLNNAFQNNQQQEIEGYLRLAKTMDKVLISSVLTCSNDQNNEQVVGKIVLSFLMKCQKLFEVRNQTKDEFMLELINKELKCVVHGLSQIQQYFPYSLAQNLGDYLQLLKILITGTQGEEDHNVLKASLFALQKILKTFLYFSPPQSSPVNMTIQKKDMSVYGPLQAKLHETYINFFNQDNIQDLLSTFITKIFPRVISDSLSEEIIELEDEMYLDDTNIFENSVYNILMTVSENLILRFPQITLQLIKQLVDNLIQSNFTNYDMQVQHGIYALIGLVPKIAVKNKIDPNQIINIFPILEYLYNNQNQNDNNARRIAIIVNRWLDHLNSDSLQKICQIIFQILQQSQSAVVKYECCMCIKNITKTDKVQLNFSELIENIAPIVIQLFKNFQTSHILWPLVYLLSLLLEKSMYSASNNVLQSFQTTDLNELIKTDNELLKNAFVEMFKNLIVSFPPKSPIQSIIAQVISFIEHSIDKSISMQTPIDQSMLQLWYVLVKEYAPEVHQQDDQMKGIFYKFIPLISSDEESEGEVIAESLYIIEEYVLLGFVPFDQYPNIISLIESKYKYGNVITQDYNQRRLENQQGARHPIGSEDNDIKGACLNLTVTLLLIYLNGNQSDAIKLFDKILALCLNDLIQPYDSTSKNVGTLRNGIQALINRFLMKYPQDIIQYINNIGINIDQFFSQWIINMNTLTSRNALKINTVTVLTILPNLSENVIKQYLVNILKKVIPDIAIYLEYQQNPQLKQEDEMRKQKNKLSLGKRRITEGEASMRKDQLRQTQLYDDVNVHQLFKTQIQAVFGTFNIDQNILQQILGEQNQGLYEQFIQIANQ